MARFVKGDVVVVPFPFSDLSQAKRRPALVISVLEGDDLILCQITSQVVFPSQDSLTQRIRKKFNQGIKIFQEIFLQVRFRGDMVKSK